MCSSHYWNRPGDPEVALAAAVIQRAVHELRHGSTKRAQQAREDIAAGGLDYWIEVLAVKYGVADALREHLARMAA